MEQAEERCPKRDAADAWRFEEGNLPSPASAEYLLVRGPKLCSSRPCRHAPKGCPYQAVLVESLVNPEYAHHFPHGMHTSILSGSPL